MTKQEQLLFESKLWCRRPFQQEMLTELENKHAAIREIAQSTATPVVDVQAAFSSFRGKDRAALFNDEMHLTPLGHQKFAEVISDFLAGQMFDRITSKVRTAAPGVNPIHSSTRVQ